jgi:hypothetical protein
MRSHGIALGLGATLVVAAALRAGETPALSERPLADRFAEIRAEYQAGEARAREATAQAKTPAERAKVYREVAPEVDVFARRMVDLAASTPQDPASRDALI